MKKSLAGNHYNPTKEIIFAIISGILLAMAFPENNFSYLAWIALVPVMLTIDSQKAFRSFWYGFLFGMVFFLITLSWITNTMINYGHLPVLVSYLALILLAIYLSLFFGMFFYCMATITNKSPITKLVLAPFLWVSLEYLRSKLFGGFPWASVGYSQFNSLPIIQISDITSMYGVSFLILLVNSTSVYFIESISGNKRNSLLSQRRPAFSIKPIIITIMVICLAYVYGVLRIEESLKTQQGLFSEELNSKPVNIKLIQGNISQDIKWNKEYQAEIFGIYKDLTLGETGAERPHLIVWPESATPFYFYNDPVHQKDMLDLAAKSGSHIFFGGARYIRNEKGGVNMFNSAFLVSPEHTRKGKYDKMHLVPFGEYVPLRKLLFFLDKMVDGIGDFLNGEEYTVFEIPEGRFSSVICFEVIFPDLVRMFVKEGAQFLVNITNDAWFGKSAASYQHIAMVAFRAVENRVSVVRAANTGITAIITPYGKIEQATDLFVRTSIDVSLTPKKWKNSFYTNYGDLFVYLCIFVTIGILSLKDVIDKQHW